MEPGTFQTRVVTQCQWLESLINKYSRPLIRYATGILKDSEAAKEVVQECFLKCMQQDQSVIKIPGWLYREVRNRAIDVWRRRRRMEPLREEFEVHLISDHPNPLEGLEVREQMAHLLQQIAKLPVRDQEVLRLKYTEELSYQQIAEVMNLTATNVGFILYQAVRSIRDGATSVQQGLVKKHAE